MASDRHLFTKHCLHTNVQGKEIMNSELIEVLPKISDRYKPSKSIPLTWKHNLTKQIVILRENKSSQVGNINNNSNNNCEESKRKAISDPNPYHHENKCRLSKRQRKLLK
jgi:hypothetical protein